MDIKKSLGQKIKEIRKSRHLTQEKLAEAIGVEPGSLCNIESGKYYPTAENLEKISAVLNVKPRELFTFDYLAHKESLMKEMCDEMTNNEELLRLMYKFFNSVRYSVR